MSIKVSLEVVSVPSSEAVVWETPVCTCVWSVCRAVRGAPGTCLWEEGRRQQAGVEEGGSRLAVCSGVFLGAFFCHVHVFGNLFRL